MWPISFREFLTAVAVLLLGSGLMFWGAAPQPEISPAVKGSGFALMAVAGAFRDFAVPLTVSGILLLIISRIPFLSCAKRERRKKPPH